MIELATLPLLVADFVKGKPVVRRSSQWPKTQREFLRLHPFCRVCRSKEKLEVHHVVPVHVDRSLELVVTNLLTLCRAHHLLFGHLGDWKSWNENCKQDCEDWAYKIVTRPRLPAKLAA